MYRIIRAPPSADSPISIRRRLGVGELARDRQAEAEAPVVAAAGRLEAGEAIEDPFAVGRGDPGAVVVDAERRRGDARRRRLDRHDDPPLAVGEGVGEQVAGDPDRVLAAAANAGRATGVELDPGRIRLGERRHDLGRDGGEVEVRDRLAVGAGIEPGELQQPVDERRPSAAPPARSGRSPAPPRRDRGMGRRRAPAPGRGSPSAASAARVRRRRRTPAATRTPPRADRASGRSSRRARRSRRRRCGRPSAGRGGRRRRRSLVPPSVRAAGRSGWRSAGRGRRRRSPSAIRPAGTSPPPGAAPARSALPAHRPGRSPAPRGSRPCGSAAAARRYRRGRCS